MSDLRASDLLVWLDTMNQEGHATLPVYMHIEGVRFPLTEAVVRDAGNTVLLRHEHDKPWLQVKDLCNAIGWACPRATACVWLCTETQKVLLRYAALGDEGHCVILSNRGLVRILSPKRAPKTPAQETHERQ